MSGSSSAPGSKNAGSPPRMNRRLHWQRRRRAKALEAARIDAKDLDLVLCATITPEMQFPATACFVASALGLNNTPAFDVSAACSGFIYALETASNYIKSGRYRNVLVIGAETLSRITDYSIGLRAFCLEMEPARWCFRKVPRRIAE